MSLILDAAQWAALQFAIAELEGSSDPEVQGEIRLVQAEAGSPGQDSYSLGTLASFAARLLVERALRRQGMGDAKSVEVDRGPQSEFTYTDNFAERLGLLEALIPSDTIALRPFFPFGSSQTYVTPPRPSGAPSIDLMAFSRAFSGWFYEVVEDAIATSPLRGVIEGWRRYQERFPFLQEAGLPFPAYLAIHQIFQERDLDFQSLAAEPIDLNADNPFSHLLNNLQTYLSPVFERLGQQGLPVSLSLGEGIIRFGGVEVPLHPLLAQYLRPAEGAPQRPDAIFEVGPRDLELARAIAQGGKMDQDAAVWEQRVFFAALTTQLEHGRAFSPAVWTQLGITLGMPAESAREAVIARLQDISVDWQREAPLEIPGAEGLSIPLELATLLMNYIDAIRALPLGPAKFSSAPDLLSSPNDAFVQYIARLATQIESDPNFIADWKVWQAYAHEGNRPSYSFDRLSVGQYLSVWEVENKRSLLSPIQRAEFVQRMNELGFAFGLDLAHQPVLVRGEGNSEEQMRIPPYLADYILHLPSLQNILIGAAEQTLAETLLRDGREGASVGRREGAFLSAELSFDLSEQWLLHPQGEVETQLWHAILDYLDYSEQELVDALGVGLARLGTGEGLPVLGRENSAFLVLDARIVVALAAQGFQPTSEPYQVAWHLHDWEIRFERAVLLDQDVAEFWPELVDCLGADDEAAALSLLLEGAILNDSDDSPHSFYVQHPSGATLELDENNSRAVAFLWELVSAKVGETDLALRVQRDFRRALYELERAVRFSDPNLRAAFEFEDLPGIDAVWETFATTHTPLSRDALFDAILSASGNQVPHLSVALVLRSGEAPAYFSYAAVMGIVRHCFERYLSEQSWSFLSRAAQIALRAHLNRMLAALEEADIAFASSDLELARLAIRQVPGLTVGDDADTLRAALGNLEASISPPLPSEGDSSTLEPDLISPSRIPSGLDRNGEPEARGGAEIGDGPRVVGNAVLAPQRGAAFLLGEDPDRAAPASDPLWALYEARTARGLVLATSGGDTRFPWRDYLEALAPHASAVLGLANATGEYLAQYLEDLESRAQLSSDIEAERARLWVDRIQTALQSGDPREIQSSFTGLRAELVGPRNPSNPAALLSGAATLARTPGAVGAGSVFLKGVH